MRQRELEADAINDVALVSLLPEALARFEQFRDLLEGYVEEEYSYEAFTARVRRRIQGEPEDWPEEADQED